MSVPFYGRVPTGAREPRHTLDLVIRAAEPADLPQILDLVRELAAYEREPEAVTGTVESYGSCLFPDGGSPTAWAHVAEVEGRVVGIAVWFLTFSTWTGRNGVWLEDLYVSPAHRGEGLGAALMAALAKICVERGYPRMEWTVLDWNEPALEVYRYLGAVPMHEWTTQRLTGDALRTLGGRA
ncbi:GNAT family N-acetyltransferase [Ornithinimicrobium sediminis]|uniref:GNAT family N-acetyltransferase n=1 Tax=Ornithinimicrobium sediminis TaxID=2904603 RepID=UPI001E48D2B8|nr:GNAT family N-acetyltransferase [Ornithinimicrobium sediminis]MCE0486387.1 GNAT family N-acetyltransferase [Ornithinimicrobium sediminis]